MTNYTPEQIAEVLKDKNTWAEGWQTRSGLPVRILCIDRGGVRKSVIALVKQGVGCEQTETFYIDGKNISQDIDAALDLIPRPKKYKGWVNVYSQFFYSTKELAERWADGCRIACIEVEFEEGEGLT